MLDNVEAFYEIPRKRFMCNRNACTAATIAVKVQLSALILESWDIISFTKTFPALAVF